MNATGKGMIAFWLHKKGENWTLQSVDKESSPKVTFQKVKKKNILKLTEHLINHPF